MIPLGPVVARSRARAPRTAVWEYFVDSERRKAWWPELQLEPRVGGAVAEQWSETDDGSSVSRDASGDIDVWVEGHAIGFRWSEAGDRHATAVLVTLRSRGAETGITVTETGFDVLPAAAERAAASQEGWQVLLADLVDSVEAAVAAGEFVEDEAAAAEEEADAASEEVTLAAADALDAQEANADEAETAVEPDETEASEEAVAVAEGLPEEPIAQAPEESIAEAAEFVDAEAEAEAEAEADEISADTAPVAEIPVKETPAVDPEPADLAFAELGFEDEAAEEIEADSSDADAADTDYPDEPNFDDLIRGPQKD